MRIIEPEIEPRLFGYISGIIEKNGGRMIEAGGDADHSHILASIGRIGVSELIGDIKRGSSSWIKKQGPRYRNFYWQRGYGGVLDRPVGVSAGQALHTQPKAAPRRLFKMSSEACVQSTRLSSTSDIVGIEVRRIQRRNVCVFLIPRVSLRCTLGFISLSPLATGEIRAHVC